VSHPFEFFTRVGGTGENSSIMAILAIIACTEARRSGNYGNSSKGLTFVTFSFLIVMAKIPAWFLPS
jgi:hypothetical protein